MIAVPIYAAPGMRAVRSRLLQAACRPRFALANLRYHIGLEPSREEHVFVLGPPRSGTTLVRQMLLAHPLLTGPDRETYFFLRWNLSDFALEEIPPSEMAAIKEQSSTSIDLFDGIARWMKVARNARAFVEKTPQHALRFSFLRKCYPRSRFIFVCRDPRDGLLSLRRNPYAKLTADAYAELWRDCVVMRLEQADPARILDLRYEDLCAAPEPHLRRMMAFLGYEMVPEQLAPRHYSVTAYAQRPGHARLNREIASETVGEWRTKATAAEVHRFVQIAGRQLHALGYEA
jgi:hypothetical protein